MPNNYLVKFAVYGGASTTAPITGPYQVFSADVRQELQKYLEAGNVRLCMSNNPKSPNPGVGPYPPFPDTAPGFLKGFGAVVTVNGVDQYFACSDGETIDFSVQPQDVIHTRVLQLTNLTANYAPTSPNLFSFCGFTLTNNTAGNFPGPGASQWVAIDFYLMTSMTAAPTAANKIGDMPYAVTPSPLVRGQQNSVTVSAKDMPNIARFLKSNPALGPAKGTTCYVFATMRQDAPINPQFGAFSKPFVY
jgi:hypothetical protein